jgi:chromosome segregation ATPase
MDVELPARRSAADQYRDAFERLKLNKPQLLPKGTPVTQNNVAKEAGSDPSALKKSRFPSLIAEIKIYVEQHAEERPPSLNQVNHLARQKSRALRDRIEQVARQRDQLASLLSEADAKIIELYDRIAELERQLPASNILSLDPRGPRKL